MSPNGAYALGQWGYYYVAGRARAAHTLATGRRNRGLGRTAARSTTLAQPFMRPSIAPAAATRRPSRWRPTTRGRYCASLGGLRRLAATGANASIYQMGTGAVTRLGSGFKVGPVLGPERFTQDSGMQQTINASGQVAGFEVVGGVNHAAVWQNGTITDLNTLYAGSFAERLRPQYGHWPSTITATLAGMEPTRCRTPSRRMSSSNPAPEPSTLLLAATGLVGLLVCAWRKRK